MAGRSLRRQTPEVRAVPAYDLERVSEAVDHMCGQQHPAHWLGVLGRVNLAHHDDVEADRIRKRPCGARRPLDLDAVESKRKGGGALLLALLRRHLDVIPMLLWQRIEVGKQQILVVGKTAIAGGAHQEVGSWAGLSHC